ncbi:MAG: AmmeMemoRadiSam system protein B [Candidatus Omnitrophota bacterium]
MNRNPVVAGQFYSGSKNALLKEVAGLVPEGMAREDAIGVVSPHAGYIYSGEVAAGVLGSIKPKAAYIILGPNHTGSGCRFALSPARIWKTPLGDVETDERLNLEIKKNCPLIKDDGLSHSHEHSIEVQLPILQYLNKNFKFVPIVISYAGLDVYRQIGKALAKSIKDLKLEKDITIIASSDMTHYEPQEIAKSKDSAAIEAILKLDEGELFERVSSMHITMCGYGPALIMIAASKALGAKKARLVKYATSGDVSGDYSSVVGYAGIIIS